MIRGYDNRYSIIKKLNTQEKAKGIRGINIERVLEIGTLMEKIRITMLTEGFVFVGF